jgi:hypothetical protein
MRTITADFDRWLRATGYRELIKTKHFGAKPQRGLIKEALQDAYIAGFLEALKEES